MSEVEFEINIGYSIIIFLTSLGSILKYVFINSKFSEILFLFNSTICGIHVNMSKTSSFVKLKYLSSISKFFMSESFDRFVSSSKNF